MTSTQLLNRITTAIERNAHGQPEAELEALTLGIIRQDIGAILIEAFTSAPCDHPPRNVHNGRCFVCGRAA